MSHEADSVHGAYDESTPGQLAGLNQEARAIFDERVEALLADVERPLRGLYGQREDYAQILESLIDTARSHYAQRPVELRMLDQRRLSTPDWFQRQDMIGYVCYTDRFSGTLSTLPKRLGYLQELGVRYLHLMPLLKPRPSPNDGGYAVVDYRDVDPKLGTMDDLRAVAADLRQHGISLVVDMVCNHTAQEHPWAQKAAAGETRYQDYYLCYPDRTEPDRWEANLPEVFPDFAPGNFTWVSEAQMWVWTTFNTFQWDLNYANPAVLQEMFEVICFLANAGVEVVRLDAVAFMWKRLGTNCQNQPEAHLILQVFRALSRLVCPAVILLAEAIVSPQDLVPYLGRGLAANKECELAYHNVFMVMMWSMLAEQNTALTTTALRNMPVIPSSTAWLTYARLHDDIGWAISDADAAQLGLSGFGHRSFLSDFYSGVFEGSWSVGEVFQANPRTGDRRISGSLASLAGLERALQQQALAAAIDVELPVEALEDEPDAKPRFVPEAVAHSDVDKAIDRIVLLHALVLSFGGIPLIYSGDEIGMINDHSYADDPDLADDNRWMHRPVMDWAAAERRHDPASVEGRVFSSIAHLCAVRAQTPELHAQCTAEALWIGNDRVLAIRRSGPRGDLLVLANVADFAVSVEVSEFAQWRPLRDLLSGEALEQHMPMAPYQVRWLTVAT